MSALKSVSSPPPYTLHVSPAVREDLDRCAGTIVKQKFFATVEQYQCDQDKLANLQKNYYGETYPQEQWTHEISVRRVNMYLDHEPSREIWRFKIWDLEQRQLGIRFFYCYFPRARAYFVLGAAPRDNDTYDYNSPHAQRVAAAYDELCRKYG